MTFGPTTKREIGIILEKTGRNNSNFWIADDGKKPVGIIDDRFEFKSRVDTSLDVDSISQTLKSRGFDHVVGEHSGFFICNHVYYQCL